MINHPTQFNLVDQTDDILLLPQTWTLLGDLGLFQSESLISRTVTLEKRAGGLVLMKDRMYGEEPQTVGREIRELHAYNVPHFAIKDSISPEELVGRTRPGSKGKEYDSEAAAMLRSMEKLRKSFDVNMELSRFKTLATGQAYSPSGTIVADFYSDNSLTRNEVDFVLGTATTEVIAKCNDVIAGFQSSANEGQVISRVVGFASPEFMSKLLTHAKVTQTHIYQQVGQYNLTQERAGGMSLRRRVVFGGIEFIEVADILLGQRLVPAGDCIFVAFEDMGSFKTYFASPSRFGYVNTLAEQFYLWSFKNERLTEIALEFESNWLNVLHKPQFVSRGYTSN